MALPALLAVVGSVSTPIVGLGASAGVVAVTTGGALALAVPIGIGVAIAGLGLGLAVAAKTDPRKANRQKAGRGRRGGPSLTAEGGR